MSFDINIFGPLPVSSTGSAPAPCKFIIPTTILINHLKTTRDVEIVNSATSCMVDFAGYAHHYQ